MPPDARWERLDEMIELDNLGPIFAHFYGTSADVPGDRTRRWRDTLVDVLRRNELGLRATVKLLGLFEQEQVPAVVLRGLALIHTIYPEPYLRPMHDVDVLVPSREQFTIVDKLARHGLKPLQALRHQFVYALDQTLFEVHWSFLTTKRYREVADFEEWIEVRRTIETPQGRIYALPPEDELLDLVCHAFIHHELDRLHPLVDIGFAVKRQVLNWDYLVQWCEKASITRLFVCTLAYADHLLRLGIGDKLARFGEQLPPHSETVFDAYSAWIFGEDRPGHYFRRKRNMLFVAERPMIKLMQVFRYFRPKDLPAMARLLLRKRQTRGG